MKVKLTLNRGSFYFLKNVHLVRDVQTEVDLTTLDAVELTGLKQNVKAGTILSDKDFETFGTDSFKAPKVEPKKEEVVVEVTEPEVKVEEVAEEAPVETTKDTVEATEEVSKETPKKFNNKKK